MSIKYYVMLLGALAPLPAQDLADVYAKVSPSVVTIHASGSEVTGTAPRIEAGAKIGSGVVLTASGDVLTAAHVIDLADVIRVGFVDGSSRTATVRAIEPGADLAVLQLQGELPKGVEPCALGDSDGIRVGNPVFVIGAPRGLERSLTAGYVSARRRDERFLGDMRFVEHLQTDAAINPGNSGGPVFDLRGDVVGIACHIVMSAAGSEGLGFAVTSNAAKRLFLDRPRPWLGFDAELLTEQLAPALNVPEGRSGLLVTRVVPASAADRAGLRAGAIPARIADRNLVLGGDIVLAIGDHALSSRQDIEEAESELRGARPGGTIRLTILRAARITELTLRLDG